MQKLIVTKSKPARPLTLFFLPNVCVRLSQSILGLSLLVSIAGIEDSTAATYRYKENAPPAKMMLDMMEVMGVIERIPDAPGGNKRGWPVTSLWGMNPGFMPNSYPAAMMSPYLMSGIQRFPGNMPLPQSYRMQPPQPYAYRPPAVAVPGYQQPRQHAPLNTPPLAQPERPQDALWSSKLVESQLADDALTYQPLPQTTERSTALKQNVSNSVRGTWLGTQGEVLQLGDNQFVWTTPSGKKNSGQFVFDGKVLTTSIPGYNAMVRYTIDVNSKKLVAITESGYRYEFVAAQ